MTVAYWCVLVAVVLPIVWAAAAKGGGEGFSNARPREYLLALSGWRARANWAQVNSYETFPPFAAGVIIAQATGNAAQVTVDTLALLFIATRILYGLLYIADRSTLRSLVWLTGFGATIGLYVAAA